MIKQLKRKKQSKRLAKVCLKKNIITKEFYDNLYIAAYIRERQPKRSFKNKYRCYRYYPELYYCNVDYWGEADEYSFIDTISDIVFWSHYDYETDTHNVNLSIDKLIKYIKNISLCECKRYKISE